LNEDNLIVEENLFGVFDGATSLDKRTFDNGKTGGFLASSAARSVFVKNHYPLVSLAKGANQEIHNQMLSHGVNLSKKENLWSTSAAVIRIKDDHLEWVQTGDCFIVLVFKDNSHKVLVEKQDHDYDTLCMWKKAVEKDLTGPDKILPVQSTSDKNRISEVLGAQIKKIRSQMNEKYGVLNGEEKAVDFLNYGYETLDEVKDILLFTDGLSIPQKKPERSKNFSSLVKNYLNLGLDGLAAEIRKTEKNDPHCTVYPRFKCHDDIAAIAIKNP
jgi:serine/threonine protein phosphatase PrpC